MLLTADWVVPVSSPPLAEGGVLVRDGAIVEVGPAAQLRARYPDEEVRANPGCALLPGFVNAHTHLDYSAFYGFEPSRGFMRWIIRLTRAIHKLDADDLAASALWGAHECLRHGVTSIADTSYGGGTVARAAQAVGLRARVYLEVFGLDDERLEATMERLEAGLARGRSEAASDLASAGLGAAPAPEVEWGVSPHATYTVSQELYRAVASYARRAGLRMATHVAESKSEVRLMAGGSRARGLAYRVDGPARGAQVEAPPACAPCSMWPAPARWAPTCWSCTRCNWTGDDLDTLAESATPVAHCPRSNLRLGCGAAPVAEMRAAGITVGLGTDSLASNDSLDMLAEMRAALEVSRGRMPRRAQSPRPLRRTCGLLR